MGIEKNYEFPDSKDSGVLDRLSPSYTKIHVDKDTEPDYCYTAIGNDENVFNILSFLELYNILNEAKYANNHPAIIISISKRGKLCRFLWWKSCV